jgi:hypothetical protein
MKEYDCPVCGWPHLCEAPRSQSGGGSYEICPACGFQFGVSDDDEGHTFQDWRKAWVARGCPWSSIGRPPPADWNPAAQLRRVRRKR